MPMQNAHELFIHGMNDMLDGERKFLQILEQQEGEAARPDLQKVFSQHRDQTEKQIERLEQCFEEIGEEPQEMECAGVKGLQQELQEFMQESPAEDIMDIFSCAAACKGEHYEIASYTALLNLAQQMGHRKAIRLLQQNLREEQQMLKKCEGLLKKLKPENMGMEEEEEEVTTRSSSRGRSRRAA